MRFSKSSLWLTAIVGVLLLAAVVTSCNTRSGSGSSDDGSAPAVVDLPEGIPEEFQALFEVYFALKEEHLIQTDLDPQILSRGAIEGMLETLDDPYASFLDPAMFKMESERFKGSLEGIGAEVSLRDGQITIIAPIPDTPADRAGIRPGDVILGVDGASTQSMSLFQVVFKIRGPKGTPVDLQILHRNAAEPVSITIIRDVVNVATVNMRILTGDIAHLKITTFGIRTNEELVEALEKAERFKVQGLVLDLRNNPGGLISAVVDVTSQFLKEGLVLYAVDGQGQRTDWEVKPRGKAQDIPMVVLVNEFSASGSEVLAGAVRDHDRAILIGTKTFGKGSVNTQRVLSDGSGIYFTISRWFTPNGTIIEGDGIKPDIVVLPNSEGLEDPQLDRAIEALEGILLGRG